MRKILSLILAVVFVFSNIAEYYFMLSKATDGVTLSGSGSITQ